MNRIDTEERAAKAAPTKEERVAAFEAARNRTKERVAAGIMCALFAVMVCVLAYAGASAASDDDLTDVPDLYKDLPTTILVGADSTGKGSAGQQFGELVAQRVGEITGGKLVLDYHANGDLGGDADLLRQMQYNDIQLVVCQTAPTVSFIPEMAVFDLPMAFAKYDGDRIDSVLNGQGEFRSSLAAAYEKADLHLLGFLQNATFRLATSNTDLAKLEDFNGLQIRTMENSNHMAFWQAIGAQPTPLAWSELYICLQNGTVDAQENAADSCVGASFQEVQKYLGCTNHILYCNQICINKEAWDSLDPAYQAALEQAVAEAIQTMRPKMTEIDQVNKQKLVDGGMKMIEYDDSFFDKVLSLPKVQELYQTIDQKQVNGLGTTLVDQLAGER